MIDFVTGDATGLRVPAHGEALLAAGPQFLTQAFHAFGALAPDNAVTAIAAWEPCGGGSTGHKFFMTLDYARPEPGLSGDLFVKFSRDFTDPRRDLQKTEMESEARFAALSRRPDFPIEVPAAQFADYHHASGTGLVITDRVAFGEGAIEPHRAKCMDHVTLADPLPYYRAIVSALGQLAGAHKAGKLAGDIDARFPWDPVSGTADRLRGDARRTRAFIAEGIALAERAPQLLPPEVRGTAFHERMIADALRVREQEDAIQRFLVGDPDLIALCHWNAHIDNCWFHRDAAGELHCGLIDWGRVGQITLGSILWGGLSAAPHVIWDDRLDELLELFVAEYREQGGPAVTLARVKEHLVLHMALMAVGRVVAFPEVVLFRLPQAVDATGPLDPMFDAVDAARNSLHIYAVMLKFWQRHDFSAAIDALLARAG